ncbi:MAG TPA: PspC domain-containing protein [Actinomycetota bacterium]|nr:PspC domain-containing protein [Actinomycetota bacterium]
MADRENVTRRLVRRTDGGIVAGVCAGLADYFGIDPVFVRIGFVALALTGGGVLAYLAAWALMPPATGSGTLPARGAPKLAAALLLVAGAIAATTVAGGLISVMLPIGPLDYLSPEPIAFAAALVVAGVLLLRAPERSPAEADHPTAPAERRTLPTLRLPARRPRERSALTPLTLAAALLAGGGTALAANVGWIGLDVGQIAALSLAIVGAGLVFGAWWGRARLLIPVGILMVPLVLVASLVDLRPSGMVGNSYVMPTQAGTLEDMKVLAGQVTLDLTEYPFADGTETARLRLGAGAINVHVPREVYVVVDATIRGGEAYLLNRYDEGFGFGVAVHEEAGPPDAKKRLKLEIAGGFGTVGVYRVRTHYPNRRRDERADGRKDRTKQEPKKNAKGTKKERQR